jgi:hypothetical protein
LRAYENERNGWLDSYCLHVQITYLFTVSIQLSEKRKYVFILGVDTQNFRNGELVIHIDWWIEENIHQFLFALLHSYFFFPPLYERWLVGLCYMMGNMIGMGRMVGWIAGNMNGLNGLSGLDE